MKRQPYLSNRSPWFEELNQWQPRPSLIGEYDTDVVVIGGGIAGAATVDALLELTDQRVMLVERDVIASGASGRSAGQAVAMLESPYQKMIERHGREAVLDIVHFLERGWGQLELMARRYGQPLEPVIGLDGLMDQQEIDDAILAQQLRMEVGYAPDVLYVDSTQSDVPNRPSWIQDMSAAQISALLDVEDQRFIAASSQRRSVLNAAQLCRSIVERAEQEQPDRFLLAERSPVTGVMVNETGVRVVTKRGVIKAKHVVYCSNGYAFPPTMHNHMKIHMPIVHPLMGYMVGIAVDNTSSTEAISYGHEEHIDADVDARSYFYLTRRSSREKDLVTLGGFDYSLRPDERYDSTDPVDTEIVEQYNEWIRRHRPDLAEAPIQYQWHGLMGYTQDGLRIVGEHPESSSLNFNIGCNGIGLLQSVASAHALVHEMAGQSGSVPELFKPTTASRRLRFG